ncbi:hypothetical protein BKA67DRAFT_611435 [Truncatella angustata]|uniref:Uncharacterized protein n=1 Tax=Truncatella angustata TaxID=152316 RepID=A0A9P8RIP6_9PEZI|nr:uncharacterized protein BKA67DRAFT_611435 [Truncatella angustata]KAH6646763.1 hypothetical protein BKA67DRAFT_611435 [Truncatella angustata]
MAPLRSSLTEIGKDVLTHFYQPVLLEMALTVVHQPYQYSTEYIPALQDDSLLSAEQAFQAFPGGDTVTAIAVLRNNGCPLYMVASNLRNGRELQSTTNFLYSLLDLIREQQVMNRKPLLKQVLWHILVFNFSRLKTYVKRLVQCLDDCLESTQLRRSTEAEQPCRELLVLRERASFSIDDESFQNDQNKVLCDCETLLKAIHGARGKNIDDAIKSQSSSGQAARPNPWHELRHYLGRLLSFRQAAEILISAFERWLSLFEDFEIVTIPSGLRMSRPLPRSNLTAAEIIYNMAEDEDEAESYLQQAQGLQSMGLEKIIQKKVNSRTFRPVVHAEVALHTHLLQAGANHPGQFWNDCKYTGGSKPTCRLCSYYFFGHRDKVSVRPTHENLYANWQFPDLLQPENRTAQRANKKLLMLMTELVRNDAKRTLDERCPRGKKHDSNTESAIPAYFNVGKPVSISEISSLLRLDEDTSVRQVNQYWSAEAERRKYGELVDNESDDDELGNAGASIKECWFG